MTWLVWRQHRAQFYAGVAVLAAFAVLIAITGIQVAEQWHSAQAACAAGYGCRQLGGLFMGSHTVGFLIICTLAAPILVGLFWGAPLVAAELETGTSNFVWTQSVTRRRWLAVKVGWMLLAAAVWGGVISTLVTWWSGPNNAQQLDQFNPGRFDLMDLVPVAYSVFSVALGIAAGALLRRVLPAMAVALAGFVAVRVVITLLVRPHYISAVTAFFNVLRNYTPRGAAWQLAQGVVGPNGQVIPQPNNVAQFDNIPESFLPVPCQPLATTTANPTPACVHALSHFRAFVTYQPADRYWAFQGIETGIFLALTAALIAVTAVVLLRRDT